MGVLQPVKGIMWYTCSPYQDREFQYTDFPVSPCILLYVPTKVQDAYSSQSICKHHRNISAAVSEERCSCFDFYTCIIAKIISSVLSFISTCSSIREPAYTYTTFFSELQMCHHNCSCIPPLRNSSTFLTIFLRCFCICLIYVLRQQKTTGILFFQKIWKQL